MDPVPPTPQAFTPPVTPLLEPKSKIWLWILGGISLLGVGIVVGIFLGKLIYSRPVLQPTPTLVAEATPSPDPTANWKTYLGETIYTNDGSSKFSIKYPPSWFISEKTLYPFGENENKGLETRILLGTGGHGFPGTAETHEFPAGKSGYGWYNNGNQISAFAAFEKDNKSYIIEVQNLPSSEEASFKVIFDQILSTFKFVDASPEKAGGYICGGIAGLECPVGYTCIMTDNYPDASGTCIKSN